MTPHSPTLPTGTEFDLPAVRRHLAQVAARGLWMFAGAFGLLLVVLSLVQIAVHSAGRGLEAHRVVLGGLILGGAVVGAQLLRRGQAVASATSMMLIFGATVIYHGWSIGLGLYSTALTGLCLLAAVTGMVLGPGVAVALTAGYAVAVAGLAWAETQGLIQGRALVANLPLAERVMGHTLLGIGGLLAALLLHRQVGGLVQSALREQQRLGELLSIGIDWTWEMDAQGRLTQVSPSFEAATGRTVAEFMQLGQPGGPQLVDDAAWQTWREAVRAGQAYRNLVVTMRCADGTELHVSGNGRPVRDAQGRVQRWIGVSRNVTAEVHAERELAQARVQAEAASRAKSDFLATMSHEIRTPLHGVLGLARLLQEPTLPTPRREEYLGHLVQAASQLSGIVSDVLDLSKIEAGLLQLEEAAFDLHTLVHESFNSFAVLGRERGLTMTLQLDAALPRQVRGDPLRVRQILGNYLGNALKFTSRGQVRLRVAPSATGRVRLEVHDSGIGIAPALHDRLFRPFGQADSSTTRRFGGTGLGLSICRDLAERMGGSVGFTSDGTSGSLFWAELPLPADTSPMASSDTTTPAAAPLAGRTVLVAEDNPVNLLIVRALLERHGARVIEAHDGSAAVQLAQHHAAELHAVLMDLHMPVLDGLAATRALRAQPATAGLPIHALSAAVLEQERRAAVEAGMNGFIAKPVDEAELLRALA